MPAVIFKTSDGQDFEVDAYDGMTAMEAALMAGVPNILGLCGGICSCATCHVQLDQVWADKVDPAGDEEQAVIDELDQRTDASRLGCQITMSDALDGLVLHVPPESGD